MSLRVVQELTHKWGNEKYLGNLNYLIHTTLKLLADCLRQSEANKFITTTAVVIHEASNSTSNISPCR